MMLRAMDLGKSAYHGYWNACSGKSFSSGADLPSWDAQPNAIKKAWIAAALEVTDELTRSLKQAFLEVEG